MKIKKYAHIAFLIVGALTVLEFLFVGGMFTWLIAVGATVIAGAVNVIICAIDRDWPQALLFVLSTIALCIPYTTIL